MRQIGLRIRSWLDVSARRGSGANGAVLVLLLAFGGLASPVFAQEDAGDDADTSADDADAGGDTPTGGDEAPEPESESPPATTPDPPSSDRPVWDPDFELTPTDGPIQIPALNDRDDVMIPEDRRETAVEIPQTERFAHIARVGLGVAVSERDGANLTVLAEVGLALVPAGAPTEPLSVESVATDIWGHIVLDLEVGLGDDPQSVPWFLVDVNGWDKRQQRVAGSVGNVSNLRRVIAPWRVGRDARIGRMASFYAPAASYGLSFTFADPNAFSTIFDIWANLPGYTYESGLGRSGRFHGAYVAGVGFQVGPRFMPSQDVALSYVLGGQVHTSLGASGIGFFTSRTAAEVHTSVSAELYGRVRVFGGVDYRVAADTRFDEIGQAFRVHMGAMVGF